MSDTTANPPNTSLESGAEPVWVLAYFRQIYGDRVETTPTGVVSVPLTDKAFSAEELHLAFSRDGLRWTPLNGNTPTRPNTDGDWFVRDPFIGRGPDGRFHLVATGGRAPRHLFYSRSRDLVHWETPRSLPVMEGVPQARNVWAPEWVFDTERNAYFVFWSSSSGEHGWDDSRIWYARTEDFQSFTTPQVLFDPGYTVIDATIVSHDGRHFLFFKDERFGHRHGEHRFIKMAASRDLQGPYETVGEAITPCLTEGPAVMRLPGQDGQEGHWQLLYDHCMGDAYAAAISTDLRHWEVAGEAEFPPNTRHASVVAVSEAELQTLRDHFPWRRRAEEEPCGATTLADDVHEEGSTTDD